MKYTCLCADKAELIAALEKETGIKAEYSGPPRFIYTVGQAVVLRDGSLECDDNRLIAELSKRGLISIKTRIENTNAGSKKGISFSTESFSGKNLTNLVTIIAAREQLINKAINRPGAFHISKGLLEKLKQTKPVTIREFLRVLFLCGGSEAIRGLHITEDEVSFPGFPLTAAYRTLAEAMVREAINRKFIHYKIKTAENEKYCFQVWLYEIGLKGQKNKRVRQELLRNLDGDSSFRTPEIREKYATLRRRSKPEPDFILL